MESSETSGKQKATETHDVSNLVGPPTLSKDVAENDGSSKSDSAEAQSNLSEPVRSRRENMEEVTQEDRGESEPGKVSAVHQASTEASTRPKKSEEINTVAETTSSQTTSPRSSSLPPMAPAAESTTKVVTVRTRSTSPLTAATTGLPRPPPLRQGSKTSSTGSMPSMRGSSTSATGSTRAASDISETLDQPRREVDPVVASLRQPPLRSPKEPSHCALFCCFYAEFDNVVGPVIRYQSPLHFMDQNTGISMDDIHGTLSEAFERIQLEQNTDSDHGDGRNDGTSEEGKDNETKNTPVGELSVESIEDLAEMSIFDATSEYIITGKELAGKMISLSTHSMHILTRPTVIVDEKYQRNSLLFSVGFVLRRAEDPRPFRPLLAKLAGALYTMEVESEFLTNSEKPRGMQSILDRILISLNSPNGECNMLLNEANWINLKLFRAPKPPATPVPDHVVPVLVREDLLNLYEWDLAIKWVALFIDGVDHTRMIAAKADVDMEMARACLRVLKHHGVISFVDMFFYSNRYECTARAAAMLAGKEPKLLQEGVDFVSRRRRVDSSDGAKGCQDTLTAIIQQEGSFQPIAEDLYSSFPPQAQSLAGSFRSASFRIGSIPAPTSHDLHQSASVRREHRRMKTALIELYCSCQRNSPLVDLLLSKLHSAKKPKFHGREAPNQDDDPLRRPRSHSLGQSEARNKSDVYGIDWIAVFKNFDLRRFVTFGIVHGLLRRVHVYPLAVEITNVHDYQNGLTNNGHSAIDDERHGLASRIAARMDGTRSDDELVCEFEKPFHELISVVESTVSYEVLLLLST